MKKLILLIFVFIWTISSFSQNVYLTSSLQEQLSNAKKTDFILVLIVLNEQLDYQKIKNSFNEQKLKSDERAKLTIEYLLNQQNTSQKYFIDEMENYQKNNPNSFKIIHKYWIVNMILVEATTEAIDYFSTKSEVRYMDYADNKITLIEPVDEQEINTSNPKNNTEIGLKAINAPAMWALGYTGRGRIVYNYDTGICPDHPAIDENYLGNYMPQSQCWYPYFSEVPAESASNHGTHTLGTMIGLDEQTNDTIGIAFNSYWIGNDLVTSTVEELPPISEMVLAFEWALDPDGNPATVSDIPDVINNSWRWYDGDDTEYCDGFVVDMLNSLELAGIATIFSGGNSGPSNNTVNSPQRTKINLVNSFCVGAINGNVPEYPITSFSTRGPSQCTSDVPLNIHPEVVAPGYDVRSCIGEDGYGTKSGTSMSCPHVSGAVLLLKEAFSDLTGEEILLALYNTAVDLGDVGEDNTYGKGIIDVFAAYEYLSGFYTPTLPTYDYDIAITNVTFQNCVDNISPTVEVVNLGTQDISSFNLYYYVDDNLLQTYTSTVNLDAGDTVEISLNSHNLSSFGDYNLFFDVQFNNPELEIDLFNNKRLKTHTYISSEMPLEQGFEEGDKPICWEVHIEAGNTDWVFESFSYEPHSGDHFAFIRNSISGDHRTKLITNKFDISGVETPVLSFWHQQNTGFFSNDILKIYYKNSYNSEWLLLEEYTEEITEWTQHFVSLPNVSDDYYIAFEGNMFSGLGICVDDVFIGQYTLIDENKNLVKVYPNPAISTLNISISPEIFSETSLIIYNNLGQKVMSMENVKDQFIQLDLSTFKTGVYYIRIFNDDFVFNHSFIVF
ncbi:MAG: S8 family serine peptidase [Bacteroidales bacterium]|nr:S8 family serine peptidase [Bacteroidales bacterium]